MTIVRVAAAIKSQVISQSRCEWGLTNKVRSCEKRRGQTQGSGLGCGWAMLQILAGVNPAPVAASHGPDIEPCRYDGDIVFDA